MTPYRVLLVDDDAFFLRVYGDFLQSRGFEVDTANGGEQAVEIYKAGRYQLVIVDLVMPGLSGIELIERIRSLNPAQDIIVVTATEDVRTAVRAMRLGVYDYLTKPVEKEELILVIDRLQERATLYDEHARLLNENIQFAELQRIVQRALGVMQSLDLETVCERILETLSDVCSAQGAVLWLNNDDGGELSMHGYRGLIDSGSVPGSWAPMQTDLGAELWRGAPVLTNRDASHLQRERVPAPALLCPLARDGRLLGAVLLVDKLGGGFDANDTQHAKLIGDCGATAVAHARRVRQLERVGLRDASTAAYNMTYFVDYLGRELHKARRYRRSFSLVHIAVDNLAHLQHQVSQQTYQDVLQQLVAAISGVLRDIDVLARVTDDEMYLLMPEVDFLGGLTFVRAAREAIRSTPTLAAIDREHPINLSFGPAAFPRDGDDVDQLFAACRRRLDDARRSLFRRLHLEDVAFWSAVDLLIGGADIYAHEEVELPKALAVTEDKLGLSRHTLFGAGAATSLRAEAFAEAARQARASGWLFLGGRWRATHGPDMDEMVWHVGQMEGGAMKTYVMGVGDVDLFRGAPHVTPVRVDGEAFGEHEVILFLAEHASYGLLGRWREDGRLYGFHTADWTLVEGLIQKLQEAYNLQKGAP